MKKEHVKKLITLVTMAMLAGISIVLVMLIHFPIFPVAPFLEYDPADIPIFIGAFSFGPWWGLLLTVVTSIIQGVTVSSTGPVGIMMHILATGSFVIVAGLIYQRFKTSKGAILALICGTITMTITMLLWNIVVTPFYMNVPRAAVIKLLPAIFLFNIIKAGGNSVITFLLYKSIDKIMIKFTE